MALRKRRQFKWGLKSEKIKFHIKFNRDTIWESQNGKKTMIKDMDYNHIKNCVAKIKREDGWKEQDLEILVLELIYRQLINKQQIK
tara:strand:+ start:1033 stop:1290 length:258 start_codon:yes stop_codon:yes gene_type:complete